MNIRANFKGFLVTLAIFSVLPTLSSASTAAPVNSPFLYDFSASGVLEEARDISQSTSPYFWLVSGAKLVIADGLGSTLQGRTDIADPWKNIYAKKSSLDTAQGFYPQNLFKLVTRSEWKDFSQEIGFKINTTNQVDSYNRDAYSGIFLISRYKDENNYYYAGLRMDGQAVIKKKVNGIFYSLGASQIFGQSSDFNKKTNPNLLPLNKDLKLRLVTKDVGENGTSLSLFVDKGDGLLTKVLDVTDQNPIKASYLAGLESDFMDVSFDNYLLTR